jgi:hypothetical protein
MNYELSHREDIVIRVADDNPRELVYDGSGYPDYQARWDEYQAWLAEGNTPEPYVEPVMPPPPTVTEKLNSMGITIADLKAALEAPQ